MWRHDVMMCHDVTSVRHDATKIASTACGCARKMIFYFYSNLVCWVWKYYNGWWRWPFSKKCPYCSGWPTYHNQCPVLYAVIFDHSSKFHYCSWMNSIKLGIIKQSNIDTFTMYWRWSSNNSIQFNYSSIQSKIIKNKIKLELSIDDARGDPIVLGYCL